MPEKLPGDSIALSWLNESVRLEPNAPYTWYFLGFFNLANGNLELGKAYYKKYLDLMPKSANAHMQWAGVLTLLKNYEEAIIENKKALELSPNNFTALNNLGNIYSVIGQYDESLRYLLKVIKMYPEYNIGYYNLCCYYSKTGKSEEAIIYLQKSFEKGLVDIKYLATDTDLENIRSIREFKALLKKYFSSDDLAKYPDMFVKASK
jgi:tetratricopeptide (TPR) repeat protein